MSSPHERWEWLIIEHRDFVFHIHPETPFGRLQSAVVGLWDTLVLHERPA